MKVLCVIDMQNDFVTGALGSEKAIKIVPHVRDYIKNFITQDGNRVFFTRDTHLETTYFNTLEGKKLPVLHCVQGTPGWEIVKEIQEVAPSAEVIDKETFGSGVLLGKNILLQAEEVVFIGVCSDICVLMNAAMLRHVMPNLPIKVVADCCAGSTPERHEAAMKILDSLQIDIV